MSESLSCGAPGANLESRSVPQVLSRQDRVQRVREIYESYLSNDLNPLFRLLHDDVDWVSHGGHASPMRGRFHGRRGVERYFWRMRALDGRLRELVSVQPFANRTAAVLEGAFVSAHRRWVLRGPWVHLYRFEGGRVRRVDLFEPRPERGAAGGASRLPV